MKIAVVTTDARMKEVNKQLSAFYETMEMKETKDFIAGSDLDGLILPVKGINEDGHLFINGHNIEISSSFWTSLPNDCRIFCGLPQEFLEQLQQPVFYYMKDEKVLHKNAALTAEGILFLLIDNTMQSIQQLKVDIIGYGRCGRELYNWLKALHVTCRVIRRKCDTLRDQIGVEDWKQGEPGDVIINTSIAPIITHEQMDQWNKAPLIIDIATEDVMDHDYAKKHFIHCIKAGNLPALIASQTAGELIVDYVRRVLKNGK